MKPIKLLEKDVREVVERFPKLKFLYCPKRKTWLLEGNVDICDKAGCYWDTFNLLIVIPNNYPHGIPIVIERSQIIPRDLNRHISNEGVCCLDIEHSLLKRARRGIHLVDFIVDKIYPYLANQLFFNENKHYAGSEYKHHFEGVRQFYTETLHLSDAKVVIAVLEEVIVNNLPGRNDDCICGKKEKFKRCHFESAEFLKSLGKERLQKDIQGFRDHLAKSIYSSSS